MTITKAAVLFATLLLVPQLATAGRMVAVSLENLGPDVDRSKLSPQDQRVFDRLAPNKMKLPDGSVADLGGQYKSIKLKDSSDPIFIDLLSVRVGAEYEEVNLRFYNLKAGKKFALPHKEDSGMEFLARDDKVDSAFLFDEQKSAEIIIRLLVSNKTFKGKQQCSASYETYKIDGRAFSVTMQSKKPLTVTCTELGLDKRDALFAKIAEQISVR